MTREIARRSAARPFTLIFNASASRSAPWTAEQEDILGAEAFESARAEIASWPGYAPTPLLALPGLAAEAGVAALHYKDEGPRFGLGSFKALGGAYAVGRLLERETGARMTALTEGANAEAAGRITVCCATDGNHGRSVAWGARKFGCRCVIFLHGAVSKAREAAIAAYGAEIRRTGGNYDDSVREAQATAAREGWFVVSDTSYEGYMTVPRDVMRGYELMAFEAFEALPEPPTHMFLQTGVGGMAAAVVAQAKRRWGGARPLVALADPERAACWVESFRAAAPRAVSGDLDTLMAGLACGEISALAWDVLRDHADVAMALPDTAAVEMMRRLASPSLGDPAIEAGESAVAGLAGLFAAAADEEARAGLALGPEARVLVFGTEGPTDPELYRAIIAGPGETE